ncbi:MAG: CesT family type III secretion system chaperone [Chlamydiales bacterium]
MTTAQLKNILKEFEPFFNCPLKTDERESTLIHMGIGIEIQIELDRYGFVLIGCRLGSMIGRFCDLAIIEALKVNDIDPPSTGMFGYSQKSKNLILFMFIDPRAINPDSINRLMTPFIKKAKRWVDGIKNNTVPSQEGKPPPLSDNPFGLQR